MYAVYMLRCEGDSLYTGYTTDLARRADAHGGGRGKGGAKYTAAHKPLRFECAWETESLSDALKLEYRLKSLTKQQKEELACGAREPGYFFPEYAAVRIPASELPEIGGKDN